MNFVSNLWEWWELRGGGGKSCGDWEGMHSVSNLKTKLILLQCFATKENTLVLITSTLSYSMFRINSKHKLHF